jgi:hypothetical protein
MDNLKVGDWAVFWTENWPPDAVAFEFPLDGSAPARNATGEGLYSGRGRIVSAGPDGWVIQEERSGRLTQIRPHERVEPMRRDEPTPMTLGELRRFVKEHSEAPDDTPVTIALPVGFTCDEDSNQDLPEDHPEAHTPDALAVVSASHFIFHSVEEMADLAGQSEDAGEGMHAGPQIEIVIHPRDAHAALRGCDGEEE